MISLTSEILGNTTGHTLGESYLFALTGQQFKLIGIGHKAVFDKYRWSPGPSDHIEVSPAYPLSVRPIFTALVSKDWETGLAMPSL